MAISVKPALKKRKAQGFFVVANDRGLHTRPSTEIVKCAAGFKSDVKLVYQKLEVSAKSLLGVLMLAAAKGAKIAVTAEGIDADEAVASLLLLASKNFNIKY